MTPPIRHVRQADLSGEIDWPYYVGAIRAAHLFPKAQIEDVFLGQDGSTLLSRAAWISGLGFGVKSVTVTSANKDRGLPTVQGAMTVFAPDNGAPLAIVDSDVLTNLKTAADSILGAQLLARPDSRALLVVGAGSVGRMLVDAYRALFPGLEQISLWNRSPESAEAMASEFAARDIPIQVVTDLHAAVAEADIVTSATMAKDPLIFGDWVSPGTHVDLIGAYRADMREGDDTLLRKSRLFVDSRASTMDHIGELRIPLQTGVIGPNDIKGDLYDLVAGTPMTRDPSDITLFKNGGGAHLDLMIAMALLERLGTGIE